jgi:hypothetical protein
MEVRTQLPLAWIKTCKKEYNLPLVWIKNVSQNTLLVLIKNKPVRMHNAIEDLI